MPVVRLRIQEAALTELLWPRAFVYLAKKSDGAETGQRQASLESDLCFTLMISHATYVYDLD